MIFTNGHCFNQSGKSQQSETINDILFNMYWYTFNTCISFLLILLFFMIVAKYSLNEWNYVTLKDKIDFNQI